MAFLVGSSAPELQRLLVPFTCALIAFLSYASQWLFAHSPDLAPGPLTRTESVIFNVLVGCTWWCYYRAVTVDPGRYEFPPGLLREYRKSRRGAGSKEKHSGGKEGDENGEEDLDEEAWERQQQRRGAGGVGGRTRWCRKCAAPKPPRAHHCKTCGRCVPRMDHHCPWTANCVSLQTFPHFLRFLVYANLALWTLLAHLAAHFRRGLWDTRHLPAYLGPPPSHLALLTVLALAAAATAFFVGILLVTTLKAWVLNTTMIEAWEIERHEAVLERLPGYGGAGDGGAYDAGDDGSWWHTGGEPGAGPSSSSAAPPEPVEFPSDIGFFANMAQAMGTRNPILWFWPLAGGPRVARPTGSETALARIAGPGWRYEENGLNDREGLWPPLDPEKARHARLWRRRRRELRDAQRWPRRADADGVGGDAAEDERAAFRRRQERDLLRWQRPSNGGGSGSGGGGGGGGARAHIMDELEEVNYDDYDYADDGYARRGGGGGVILDEGAAGWVNADGEKLGDYGVDEDAEFDDPPVFVDRMSPSPESDGNDDDDEVPLAELIRRRKVRTKDGEDT